jgi:hypothetical protein
MVTALDPTRVKPAPEGAPHTRRVLVKKLKPAKPIKKYIWLAGHGITLCCGAIYLVFYIFQWWLSSWWWTSTILYRFSFVGVMLAYSISILTTFGTCIPPYNTLLVTENFQTMIIATIWLWSRSSAFKLFPFMVVAALQLSSEYNFLPVLKLQNQLGDCVGGSEIIIILVLLFDTFLFRGTSGYALVLYLLLYSIRVQFSPYTQSYLLRLMNVIDERLIKKQKDSQFKFYWAKVKQFLEIRRSQTTEALEKGFSQESLVHDKSEYRDSGKVLESGKDKPPVEQKVIENERSKKTDSKIPPHVGAPSNQSSKETYEYNIKAGMDSQRDAAGGVYVTGLDNAGLKVGLDSSRKGGSQQGEIKVGDGLQNAAPPIPKESNDEIQLVKDEAAQVIAEAQFHDKNPEPKEHALDPRKKLIASAQGEQ